ncbi:MAG TPA: HhoA/HhoB/HtrA family serine endopeptidase [Stenomitos sp.]
MARHCLFSSVLHAATSFSLARRLRSLVRLGMRWGISLGLCLALLWPQAVQAEPMVSSAVADTVSASTSKATRAVVSDGHSFVAAAVQKVGNTIVRIDTERTIIRRPADPLFSDPLFRDFFGEGYAPVPREDRLRGQGSGFIIDGDGIILTNAHVVNDADTVSVTLKDGRTFEGTVQGVDEVSDLAVVKLRGVQGKLPVATLGDSNETQVGDWAIAVGNPVGLDNTVTLGIISTLHRPSAEVGIPNKRLDFIQTDAAINPGNSGGPLLNAQGEVIGINTAIRADAMGIGFAIPINKAKELKDKLVRGERILHPYIGVQMTTLTPKLAQENNSDPNSPLSLPEVNGVLVIKVLANTPAASAGMRLGDVIVAVNGTPISTANQFQAVVESTQVGQMLDLTVRRGSRTQSVAVKAGELKSAA